MTETRLSLGEIHGLALECLQAYGADEANAGAVAETVTKAERDGAHSHGLFRLPGYVASLKSGKVNGKAEPKLTRVTSSVLQVDGDGGYAPLAHKLGCPALAEAAKSEGIAALALIRTFHFAALWPEVEALAEQGVAGFACTAYKPSVAPAGARQPLYGTNPIAFAWPREGRDPLVFDMATAAKAMGEIKIAAREGQEVPLGTGLDAKGNPTTDPKLIEKGVLLPFGGYKGSAIAMMVELLAGALIGERFSFEAAEADNNDGGPPRGGEFLFALSPEVLAGSGWQAHAEAFFGRYEALDGARLPGARRHAARERTTREGCLVNSALLQQIRDLIAAA